MTLFWLCMALLVLLGVVFIALPLWFFRKLRGAALPLILVIFLPFVSLILYQHWGNYEAVKVNEVLLEHQTGSPKQLVADLEKALKKQPENYRAWYLLGESWMASRQFSRAESAFEKVVSITGDAPEPLSKYAQALFLANDSRMTPTIAKVVDRVLIQSPDDRTALGLAGINYFEQKHYSSAIKVWKKLLTLTEKPHARNMIESGIKKAQQLDGSFNRD